MASASTSKAATVATPSAAAPTPARITPVRTRLPGNQALLRLQRRCSCGAAGTCDACQRKAAPGVQMKVPLGPVNDPFEREADAVAERVMGAADPGAESHAPVQVQRACASCAEADEQQQDPGLGLQRAASPAAPVQAHADTLSHASLTQGGDPLPAAVRAFFDPRFGRDFSSVRVHTGSAAAQANIDLHAHAFTYGEHVWMGQGQPVAANALLAHELAHVVQQRRPPALAGQPQQNAADSAGRPGLGIQRLFTPFWEPGDITSGNENHALVLPKIGAKNKFFTEAPIPNAKTSKGLALGKNSDYDVKGRADFYQASTTIGVYFSGAHQPKALQSDGRNPVLKDGASYSHATTAAPKVVNGALTNSASGPTSITIGDLKPSHGTVEALAGPAQLEAYKEGIELAHREALDPATSGDGASWGTPSISFLNATSLAVPDEFVYPNFTGQTSRNLVIKKGTSKKPAWIPKRGTVMGRISVKADPGRTGIWNYAWVPDITPKKADLPASLQKMPDEVTQRIYDPLLQSPLVKAKKARTDRPAPLPIANQAQPSLRRKDAAVAPEKDSFDYDKKWKPSHEELTKKFNTAGKTQEFKDVEGEILANQAHEALRTKMGLPLTKVAGSEQASEGLAKIDFWTGASALPFGFFRNVFGIAFVKVAQFFIKMRDKVRAFLTKMKSGTSIGGDALGAALKAAFRGLKIIAKFVVGRVTDRLMASLSTGVINKLTALIPPAVSEELEVQKEKVEQIRASIEKKALDTVDQLLEKAFGVHLADLQKLGEIYQTLQAIPTLINLVRWGARVIACLSPPAWGCLWILAEAALNLMMQKVTETCWFQKKIQPILAKVQYITTDLPNKLGDAVIGKVKSFLPDSVSDVFADLNKSPINAENEELECEEDMDKTIYQESPLHQEMDDLYKKIGPERAAAFQELAKQMNVPKDRPLTSAELSRLGDELAKMTPEDIAKVTANYPAGAPDAAAQPFNKLLKDIEGGKVEATAPPREESQVIKDPAGPAAGGEEGGDEKGAGAELKAVEADERKTTKASGTKTPNSSIRVVNPAWSHTLGDMVAIHLVVSINNEARLLIRNAKAKVGHRYWWPKTAKAEAEAVAIVIPYEIIDGIDIPELGGFIKAGSIMPAYLYTALGHEAQQIAEQHAQGKQ